MAFNNSTRPVQIGFDVVRAGLANGLVLTDRLAASNEARVLNGKMAVSLPERAAAVLVRK